VGGESRLLSFMSMMAGKKVAKKPLFFRSIAIFCVLLYSVKRLNVGVCLISTHFFGCPLPTFYQFALGCINLFNFTKSLNDMKTLGNFLERWAFGELGGKCSKKNAW
jgi:hypothetical protein